MACALVTQAGLSLARPLVSYKVIVLGGGAELVGLVTATYALLPVVVAIGLGRLSDRASRLWPLLAAGAFLLALAPALFSMTDSIVAVTLVSAVLGLGHLVFIIAAQGTVARLSDDANLDRDFAWFTAAVSSGQLVGPALSGVLLGYADGDALVSATRQALWVAAALSLVAVPSIVVLARRWPRLATRATSGTATESSMGLLRRPGVGAALFSSMALLATIDILTAYLPLIGQSSGIPPVAVGALLSLRAAASIGSRLLLSRMLHRWSRRALVAAGSAGAAAALALVPLPGAGIVLIGVAMVVCGFFLGLGQPLTMTLVVRAVRSDARGTALALRLLGNRVGQVALPGLAGLVAGPLGAGGALWLSCAVLGAAAALTSATGRAAD